MTGAVEHALALAERGIPVFPCKADKSPHTGHGFKAATTDAEQISAWWRRHPSALVGVPTGKASGLLVVDIDPDGATWYSEHAPELAAGRIHKTRRGHHLIYRMPDADLRNSAGQLAPGVDIRGNGGYTIYWPAHDLETVGDFEDIGPPPPWLLEKLRKPASPEKAQEPTQAGISAGARNDFLSREAYRQRRQGATVEQIEQILTALNAARCTPPLSAQEVRTIAEGKRDIEPEEDEQPAARLQIVPTDLDGPMPPTRYVVEPILPRRVASLMGGHGGSGKSLCAAVIASHAACGRAWAGLETIQARTLFVSLEDPANLVRLRLRRIVDAYDLDPQAIEDGVTIVDGSDGVSLAYESNEHGHRRLALTAAYDDLREMAAGYGLIVIDNASDAFDADENNRRMVRAFIRALTRIAREQDAALLLLAHIDKAAAKFGSNGNSYSGSTAWHNSARSRLALVESDGRLELRHEKANLGPRMDPIHLEWTADGVLMPVSSTETTSRDDADEEAALIAIKAAIESGADVPTGRTGPSNTYLVLNTFPDLPDDLRGPSGKRRFWAAVTRLDRSGRIVVDEYRDSRRHIKRRWICAGSSVRAFPPHPLGTGAERSAPQSQVCASSRNPRKPAQPAQDYRSARDGE